MTAMIHLHGGPAPVRRYMPGLIDLVLKGAINPGKVFDLTLPLSQVAEAYRCCGRDHLPHVTMKAHIQQNRDKLYQKPA